MKFILKAENYTSKVYPDLKDEKIYLESWDSDNICYTTEYEGAKLFTEEEFKKIIPLLWDEWDDRKCYIDGEKVNAISPLGFVKVYIPVDC